MSRCARIANIRNTFGFKSESRMSKSETNSADIPILQRKVRTADERGCPGARAYWLTPSSGVDDTNCDRSALIRVYPCLSAFIRGSHFVTIVQLCPVLLTPSKSHVVPTELLVLISVPFWFGLLPWDKELLDFEFVADFELRTSVYCPPLCQT